ncbi:MAG: type II toxin-antitoxin system VapC family toxin [Hyphomonadaceae bacterium]|nr:type II toxin-antitoxin system VapC family toxin [Hyphomonadaceae bacterium]
MIHVDTNVIIDVLDPKSAFHTGSREALAEVFESEGVAMSQVVYSELAVGFSDRADLDRAIGKLGVTRLIMSDDALFLAGRAYAAYRRRSGKRESILPDFFIGAHALSADAKLLTRDPKRYRTAFPTLKLIEP